MTPTSRVAEPEIAPDAAVEWIRHPADAARAVVALLVWGAVALYAVAYPSKAQSLSLRVVEAVAGLPPSVSALVIGLLQVLALAAPLAALLAARRGRWRELGTALLAAAATAVLGALTNQQIVESVPVVIVDDARAPSWITASSFPSSTYLAAVAAAATVIAPMLTQQWRRLLWGAVGVVALARVVTAVEAPVGILSLLAVGVFVGSLVMFALKVPVRSSAPATVASALAAAGIPVTSVVRTAQRHRHGPTYVAEGDGTRWFVKGVGRDERDAEVLARVLRALRARDPSDRRTLAASETIAREALGLFLAAEAGASVPAVRTTCRADDGTSLLVMEQLDGETLDRLDDVDDPTLAAAFASLAALHRRRIAHGWISLHQVLRRTDGAVSLLDLRWSTPSASDEQLAADVAELLASAAGQVGVSRAVAAARTAFDDDALVAALPLLQPLAVSPETRVAVRRDKALLGELRAAVQEATGAEAYELAPIQRLSLRLVVSMVGGLVMALVLLTLIGNAAEIWDALKDMNPAYLPVLLVLSLASFPAGAASLIGAVTGRLPFWATTEIMFAQSFLNRFTPANAGGMALRTRYLQNHGITLLTAASAVAITSLASGVMQVVMAIGFFAWAGRDDAESTFAIPSGQLVALVVVGAGVVLGIAWATTAGRKLLQKAWESLSSTLADIRELARHPSKLVLLFGGAGASKLFSILSMAQTMRAFGVPVDLPAVGAMYITATTVASAAPTPGGVGAIEAALTAGLVGLGVDVGQAAAIVLVFRLFTYWLPTLPSWWALTRVQRRGEV